MPRNEKVKKINFPESTDTCLIVNSNLTGLGFRYDTFNNEIVKDRCPYDQYKETLY